MEIIKKVLFLAIGIVVGIFMVYSLEKRRYTLVPTTQKNLSKISKHDIAFYLFSDSLKQRVLNGYDAEAYRKLKILSYDEHFTLHANDMLYYEMLMAEKYKNSSACYNVYETMIGPCVPEDTLVDYHDFDIDEFRRIGLYYLKLGEQLGDYNCAYTIYELLYYHKIDSAGWKPVSYYEKRADKLLAERW